MTAYRFCRSDDIPLLVAAYERCRGEEDAAEEALDRDHFKQLIREVDLWCSSCLVALEGSSPVGALLGAKRPDATLVWGLRVHPEHRRRGHGRHLLTSLSQKLAILGPPSLVAEVAVERESARALFTACGFTAAAELTTWRREPSTLAEALAVPREASGSREWQEAIMEIPVSELASCGLTSAGDVAWQRSAATWRKLDQPASGLAFASPERIEAFMVHRTSARGLSILAAASAPGPLAVAGLLALLGEVVRIAGPRPIEIERLADAEIPAAMLDSLGFYRMDTRLRYLGMAKPG